MSITEQRLYEAIAGTQLRAAGYPTPHQEQRRLGAAECVYWEANHLLRKTLKQKYWSDTVYRAGVRMRTAGQLLRHTPR